MLRLEAESRKRTQRANLNRLILTTVAAAGVLSIMVVAPNVLGVMVKMGLVPHKRQKEFISRARSRLIQQDLLEYQDNFLRLTPKGKKVLKKLELNDFKTKKPKRWDGKWRVLIFDIPEYRKNLRDKIRLTLRAIGFVRLQDSVWLYPYDCEGLIVFLKADFHVGKDVLYLIVDALEHDTPYRRHFGLPLSY